MDLIDQIRELAKVGTPLQDVMILLSLSRTEVNNTLKENGFNSYKELLKQEGAVSKKIAKETMFVKVFEAPTPLVGDAYLAEKLLKLIEATEGVDNLCINSVCFDVNTIKTLVKREHYNDFKMCYDFLVVLNPSSNYAVATNNITLKFETEQERDLVFEEITKKIL